MTEFLEATSDKLSTIPGALIALFLVFIIHELGHYWAARMRRMTIEEFSVGIGKKLWGITDRHGTEWVFRIFPIGGHVRISDLTLDENTNSRRSVGTRLWVVLAGPGANLLLPFIILPLCFILVGFPIRPPVLSGVTIGSAAETAGLQRGDFITHVNDIKIHSYDQLGDFINNSKGQTLNLGIIRAGQNLRLSVTPKKDIYIDIVGIPRNQYRIGVLNANLAIPLKFIHQVGSVYTKNDEDRARAELIKSFDRPIRIGMYNVDDNVYFYPVVIRAALNQNLLDEHHKKYEAVYIGPLHDNAFLSLSPTEAARQGINEAGKLFWHMLKMPFQIFPIDPKLFAERIPFETESIYYYHNIIYQIAFKTALLSILIGFINLIPFPRLDGDFVLTYIMEGALKKKPSRKQRAIAIAGTLFCLYAVMMFSNLGDLPGYMKRKLETYTGDPPLKACKLLD